MTLSGRELPFFDYEGPNEFGILTIYGYSVQQNLMIEDETKNTVFHNLGPLLANLPC